MLTYLQIGISPRMQRVFVVMNLILGFCRPQASAQGLLMATINLHVQCPVVLGYNVNWCVMNDDCSADDASIISHYF